MRILIVFVLLLQTTVSFGVDFSKLSRSEPISTLYPANFKCYVDVSLFLNVLDAYKGPVFLRVSYVIGNDTLNDNLEINGSFNGVIKQIFLDEGERLTAFIHLNNGETEEIDGIEGSLRIVRNPDFKPTEEQGKSTFLSGVWKSDQTPLFRVAVNDSTPKLFRLKLTVDENFEFDKLYFKMKVISPAVGILMLNKQISVNEGAALDLRKKSFKVDLEEINLSTVGTYYFQVMPDMNAMRLNGVRKIEYEIVAE